MQYLKDLKIKYYQEMNYFLNPKDKLKMRIKRIKVKNYYRWFLIIKQKRFKIRRIDWIWKKL